MTGYRGRERVREKKKMKKAGMGACEVNVRGMGEKVGR